MFKVKIVVGGIFELDIWLDQRNFQGDNCFSFLEIVLILIFKVL